MRFLVDMPLSPSLAQWLVRKGHEAVHALELGLARAPDRLVLERARDEGRVIITADLDFPRLLSSVQSEGPGLILFRGGDYTEQEAITYLHRALDTIPEGDLPHSIVILEKGRIRRRRLPI